MPKYRRLRCANVSFIIDWRNRCIGSTTKKIWIHIISELYLKLKKIIYKGDCTPHLFSAFMINNKGYTTRESTHAWKCHSRCCLVFVKRQCMWNITVHSQGMQTLSPRYRSMGVVLWAIQVCSISRLNVIARTSLHNSFQEFRDTKKKIKFNG